MGKQKKFFKNDKSSYGGELLKKRKARTRGRPLHTKHTMHLVLRSTKAKGSWSFKRPKHEKRIAEIIARFSAIYGVDILSLANVGNHLHLQIKLSNRYTYRPFIRAITGAITMAVTGCSRWRPLKKKPSDRFWDYRPFTRIVFGERAFLTLRDYIAINKIEGYGYSKSEARFLYLVEKAQSTA